MTPATPRGNAVRRLVLASSSPRRRELLAALAVPFTVDAAEIAEEIDPTDPVGSAARLANEKALVVASRRPHDLVLAADTIVLFDDSPLGKPADSAVARRTLERLRGQTHQVWTCFVIVAPGGRKAGAEVETSVTMRDYSDAEITASIRLGTPFDKAGGYGIQDPHLNPVREILGCYCNVMGLPLWAVRSALQLVAPKDSVAPPSDRLPRCETCPNREA